MTTRPWMLTSDGQALDLLDPQPGAITAGDIAWALAQENRFSGRCIRPYSVAEHSLLVCEIAEVELGLDVHGQFAALLHDAHEAYTRDMSTPLKQVLGSAWQAHEQRWQRVVQKAFGCITSSTAHAAAIKEADLLALATERRQLMPLAGPAWQLLEGIKPVPWVDLMSPQRVAMTWADWRDRWLDTYQGLDFARCEQLGMPATGVAA